MLIIVNRTSSLTLLPKYACSALVLAQRSRDMSKATNTK